MAVRLDDPPAPLEPLPLLDALVDVPLDPEALPLLVLAALLPQATAAPAITINPT